MDFATEEATVVIGHTYEQYRAIAFEAATPAELVLKL